MAINENAFTPALPPTFTNAQEFERRVSTTVNNILKGKTNNVGEVTLTANSTTTTVSNTNIGINSTILLQPVSLNAADALSATYVGSPGDGTVVINHANAPTVDRTFRYCVVG